MSEHSTRGWEWIRRMAPTIVAGRRVPQRQDSLTDQLNDLRCLAVAFGLYDADEWLVRRMLAADSLAAPSEPQRPETVNPHD